MNIVKVMVGTMAMGFVIHAEAQAVPGAGQDAVGQVTGGISNFLGSIFSPTENAFRNAVKERRFSDALVIYDKDGTTLYRSKDLAPDIEATLTYARSTNGIDVEAEIAKVEVLRGKKAYQTDLRAYISTVQKLSVAQDRYIASGKIIRDNESTDQLLSRAKSEKSLAMEVLRSDLAAVYRNFPHDQLKFSEVLGEGANEAELLETNWAFLAERSNRLNDSSFKLFLKNTAAGWSSSPSLRERVGGLAWVRMTSGDSGPLASLKAMSKIDEYGLKSTDIRTRPLVRVVDSSNAPDAPLRFTGAHDGLAKSPTEVMPTGGELVEYSTVLLQITESKFARNIMDKKEVTSEYRSGSRSLPNPQYAIGQMECQRAQTEASAQQARNAIAPARGWGAVFQGVAEGLAIGNARNICNQFANIPPTTEEDVFTPYSYTVMDIEIQKSARGRVVALNAEKRQAESYPVSTEHKQVVKVGYGRKDGDRGSSAGLLSDGELDALATKPFEVNVQSLVLAADPGLRKTHSKTEVLALLTENGPRGPITQVGTSQAVASTASTRQIAWSGAANMQSDQAAVDSRMQSVVVVLNPKGSIGAGFYVDRNNILTNFHVIEGTSTIEIRSLDGQLFTGRVVKKDIGTDLALIQVERSGNPVQFTQSILKVGDAVEAIGHPKGLFFSVSRGIVSAVRQMKGMLAPGGDRALVIQTDAAINPGNSGGPLFIGDRVVGVNTIKFKGADGIGFAVHYSEVLKFLSQ